jgi:hypothetical protein
MSQISDHAENAILNLILRATAWTGVADNAASSPLTNLHFALATADPGDAGTMSTSEITYTSYARVNVARSTGFGAASGGVSTLAANTDFPAGTGGSGTATHLNIGRTGGGTVDAFFRGAITPNIVTGNGVTPRITSATTITLA